MMTRREFLAATLVAPATFASQTSDVRYIGDVALRGPAGGARTLERLIGRSLSARLSTDLSKITATDAISTDRFFVRTAEPQKLPEKIDPNAWAIEIGGLAESMPRATAASLATLTPRTGRYLLECSGNSDPSSYGLLSTADWEGVLLLDLVDRVTSSLPSSSSSPGQVSRILIAGLDVETAPGRPSPPGCTRIFSSDESSR